VEDRCQYRKKNIPGFVEYRYICEKLDDSVSRRAHFHGIRNPSMYYRAVHVNFAELNLAGGAFIVRAPKLIC
jgi:hypothetical protein